METFRASLNDVAGKHILQREYEDKIRPLDCIVLYWMWLFCA